MPIETNSIEEFGPQTESTTSLADVTPNVDEKAPAFNRASNNNLAAFSAMFSENPDEAINNYQAVSAQMDDAGTSSVSDRLVNSAVAAQRENSLKVLPTLLADKSLSDEEKGKAIKNIYDDNSPIYDPANILAGESLVQESPGESKEAEEVRFNSSMVIDRANKIKRAQQNLLNNELAKQNPDLTDKIFDFTQLMVPFVNQFITAKATASARLSSGDKVGAITNFFRSFVDPGGAVEDARKMIANAPPEKQIEMAQKLLDIVKDTGGVVMSSPNHFKQVQLMQQMVGEGEVDNADRAAEAITSIADLAFGMFSAAKAIKAVKIAKDASAAEEAFLKGGPRVPPGSSPKGSGGAPAASGGTSGGPGRGVSVPNTIITRVQPTSVSQVLKDTNPSKFRDLHAAMAADESGSVAEAAYGTTREDAIISDLGPQVGNAAGSVTAKVSTPDANFLKSLDIDPELETFIKQDGGLYYTDAQRAANQANIVHDFKSAMGMVARKEMLQILAEPAVESNGVNLLVKAVYGPEESGFLNPKQAIETIKYALRDYGVTDESLQLLKRDGGDYVPVDKNTVIDPGFTAQNYKAAYKNKDFAVAKIGNTEIRLAGTKVGDEVSVHSFDKNGKEIGNIKYKDSPNGPTDLSVSTSPNNEKLGVTRAMVDYLEKHGFNTPDLGREVGGPKASFGGDSGDYLVQVTHRYRYNPFNMKNYPTNTVKNNHFMRLGILQGELGAGSLQRHLVNITSMLEPHITLSMSKAVTKTAGVMREFVRLAHEVATSFNGLSKPDKALTMELIKQGNYEGKWWSPTEMLSMGLSDGVSQTLNRWRKYWDNHYFFENLDHTRSLANDGYMMFVDPKNDSKMWARKIKSVVQVPTNVTVYDPVTDELRVLRDSEVVDIYNSGGIIAELERPELLNGVGFQHILSRENSADGYLRAFNEFDVTLSYRPGYYTVSYKHPWFIDKHVVDKSGRTIDIKPISTAGNLKDAQLIADRLNATDGGTYVPREARENNLEKSRDNRSVQRSNGRSAQRFRGKRLEDASAHVSGPDQANIQSPSEALVTSARSISRRISMRDPIDAMKMGLVSQYKDLLPSLDGRTLFPGNVLDIKNYSGIAGQDGRVADARSTFLYIQQMEGAFINVLDNGYKAILNKVANVLGNASTRSNGVVSTVLQKAEEGTRAVGSVAPSKVLRSSANDFFIVSNSLRQLLLQSHQIAQLVPMNPKFFYHGENIASVMFLVSKQLGAETTKLMADTIGMTVKEADQLWKDFKLSGNYAAVDVNTMVNESIKDFIENVSTAGKAARVAGKVVSKPLEIARAVGFNAGENLNQAAAWLVFRDLAKRAGHDVSNQTVKDRFAATATQFTGNMNKAGQNPYEANFFSIGMQFIGWVHRWGSILTGSRVFSKGEKAKLWAWQILMYGIGVEGVGYIGKSIFSGILPKDPEARDQVAQGITGATYNKLASVLSQDDVHADWSGSLSPFDLYGAADHLKAVMTGDVGSLFGDSPVGTMFFGGNPKITNLVKDAARWSNLIEDDEENPVKMSMVAKDFLTTFSGLSNAYKTAYAIETGKKLSTYSGKVVDKNISTTQSLLFLIGIEDMDTVKSRYINGVMSDKYKELEKDVKYFHDQRQRVLLAEGITPDQVKYYLSMTNSFWRPFKNNHQAMDLYKKMLARDMEQGDARAIKQVLRMHGMMSQKEAESLANLYPDTEADARQQYLNLIKFLYNNDKKDEEK